MSLRSMLLRSLSILIPKRIKNLNFPLKTYEFQNLGNKILYNADHRHVKKPAFELLAAKLWLKESTILWNAYTFERMNLNEYQG